FAPADDGRVKYFKKLALAGTLPPVIVLFVTALNAHVVLDGHDRLVAAAEATRRIPMLRLVHVVPTGAETPPPIVTALERAHADLAAAGKDLRAMNAALAHAHAPRDAVVWRTRAWPVPGGAPAWDAEVRARAREENVD